MEAYKTTLGTWTTTTRFPSPSEVTGVSYVDIEEALPLELTQFPSPSEVNGGLTYRPEFYRIVMVNFRPLAR